MNQHNDNLEQFFRKGLNEDGGLLSNEPNWDMPSDAVWEGIEDALPRERNRGLFFIPLISSATPIRKMKWLSAASVLLLLSLYVGSQFDNLQERDQQNVAVELNEVNLFNEENKTNISSELFVNTNPVFTSETKSNLASLPNATFAIERNSVTNAGYLPLFLETRAETIPSNNNDLNALSQFTSFETMELPSNEFSFSIVEIELPEKNTWEQDSEIISVYKKPKRFYAGIFTGPARWKTKIVNKVSDAILLKRKVKKETQVVTTF